MLTKLISREENRLAFLLKHSSSTTEYFSGQLGKIGQFFTAHLRLSRHTLVCCGSVVEKDWFEGGCKMRKKNKEGRKATHNKKRKVEIDLPKKHCASACNWNLLLSAIFWLATQGTLSWVSSPSPSCAESFPTPSVNDACVRVCVYACVCLDVRKGFLSAQLASWPLQHRWARLTVYARMFIYHQFPFNWAVEGNTTTTTLISTMTAGKCSSECCNFFVRAHPLLFLISKSVQLICSLLSAADTGVIVWTSCVVVEGLVKPAEKLKITDRGKECEPGIKFSPCQR